MQGVILSGGLTAVLVAATTCSGATFTAGDLVSPCIRGSELRVRKSRVEALGPAVSTSVDATVETLGPAVSTCVEARVRHNHTGGVLRR